MHNWSITTVLNLSLKYKIKKPMPSHMSENIKIRTCVIMVNGTGIQRIPNDVEG